MRHVTHMNESRHTYEAHSKVEEIAVAEGSDEGAVVRRAPYCYLCDKQHIQVCDIQHIQVCDMAVLPCA